MHCYLRDFRLEYSYNFSIDDLFNTSTSYRLSVFRTVQRLIYLIIVESIFFRATKKNEELKFPKTMRCRTIFTLNDKKI